jgi:hypothetical protein
MHVHDFSRCIFTAAAHAPTQTTQPQSARELTEAITKQLAKNSDIENRIESAEKHKIIQHS